MNTKQIEAMMQVIGVEYTLELCDDAFNEHDALYCEVGGRGVEENFTFWVVVPPVPGDKSDEVRVYVCDSKGDLEDARIDSSDAALPHVLGAIRQMQIAAARARRRAGRLACKNPALIVQTRNLDVRETAEWDEHLANYPTKCDEAGAYWGMNKFEWDCVRALRAAHADPTEFVWAAEREGFVL